jgi:VCBS repeat-containing protein
VATAFLRAATGALTPSKNTSTPESPAVWVLAAASRREIGNTDNVSSAVAAPTNSAPVIKSVKVSKPSAVTGAVTGIVKATDADKDVVALSAPAKTSKGLITFDTTTGSFTYTPTEAARHAAATVNPTAKTDAFVVTATDGHGATTTQTIAVTIAPKNSAPVLGTTPTVVNTPNTTTGIVTGKITATDADNDALTYTSTPKKGTITFTSNGNFTYTPTEAARHSAAADNASAATKSDTFTVTITDAHGGTITTKTLTVTITPKNTAPATPTITLNAPNTTTGAVTGKVSAPTDADSDTLTYSATATKGTIKINAKTGEFTYTPTTTARHTASATNATTTDKQDTITITTTDGHGGTTTRTATLTITPKNTPPSGGKAAVNAPDATTGVVTGTLSGTDSDKDVVTFSVPITTAKGSLSLSGNTFIYTPSSLARNLAGAANATAADKQDSFTVTATDAHGGTSTFSVTVKIAPRVSDNPGSVGNAPGPYVITGAFGPFTSGTGGSDDQALTVAPDGRVYVVVREGLAVLNPVDRSTKLVVQKSGYVSVAAAPDGRIYVVNRNTNSVDVVSANLSSVRTVALSGYPGYSTMGSDGRFYVRTGGSITVLNKDLSTSKLALGSVGGTGKFSVGADGYLWTSFYSSYSEWVGLINTKTGATSTFNLGWNRDTSDIDVGPDGRAYVTDSGQGNVTVLSHAGASITLDTIIDLGDYVRSAAFTPYGDLVLTRGGSLTVITPLGSKIGENDLSYDVNLGAGEIDIAVGPDGRVYLTTPYGQSTNRAIIQVGFDTGSTTSDPSYSRLNASSLYRHLRQVTDKTADIDGIVIDKVVGLDNKTRLVVLIGGTTPEPGASNQPLLDNGYGIAGLTKANQVALIRQALSASPGAEIMLVGYSQGGMDAQVLALHARELGFNVTTLVTYGSPIVQAPISGINTVHIVDQDDPIVNTFSYLPAWNADLAAGQIFSLAAGTDPLPATPDNIFGPLNVHTSIETYATIGNWFSAAAGGGSNQNFKRVQADLLRFEGLWKAQYGAD